MPLSLCPTSLPPFVCMLFWFLCKCSLGFVWETFKIFLKKVCPFHIRRTFIPGVQTAMNQVVSWYMANARILWKGHLITLSLKYLKTKFFSIGYSFLSVICYWAMGKKDWPLYMDLLFHFLKYIPKTFLVSKIHRSEIRNTVWDHVAKWLAWKTLSHCCQGRRWAKRGWVKRSKDTNFQL